METTMAATPKARLALESPLAFPVPPPPPNTERLMPVFAFPPANDAFGPTRPQELNATRRTTARVPRRKTGSLSDGLAGLASFVENAPMPVLPESAWTIIGRAWFFIAGTTMGILLAFALIAMSGPKSTPSREAHSVVAQGTARVLVVQRAPTAAERAIGALAENDLDDLAPAPAPIPAAAPSPAVVRRTATASISRRSSAAGNRAPAGKDILNAGL